jgi:hypothetical protein
VPVQGLLVCTLKGAAMAEPENAKAKERYTSEQNGYVYKTHVKHALAVFRPTKRLRFAQKERKSASARNQHAQEHS